MEEINFPVYTIEWFETYVNAVWLYEKGGVDDSFRTMNFGEEIARFTYEEDAREYFKRHKCDRMSFWDPMDYKPEEPVMGISYYLLVKYDYWGASGKVLEGPKGSFSRRQMTMLFKDNEIDLKELLKKENETK